MPKRNDIKSILVIGAGPIIIGQACEFDYSGTQACKALKEEGYRVILVNSNPATIMTDPDVADVTYIEPITIEFIEKVIIKEKPDALLPTVGGQTALNCAVKLANLKILEKYNVKMIGASIEAIEKAENRLLFKEAMSRIGLECPRNTIAHNLEEALKALDHIGLPAIIRPSFTLGGAGGGIAYTKEDFERIVLSGLDASANNEILIDESIIGWKEFEMEAIRDMNDNCIIVCSIENLDPMGVHTGDSITVAPALTLTDKEYQKMRNATIRVLREIGVDTGGANVQFAVNAKDGRMLVIEMNPRVSRSSALASKATGFPIAKIAAKLAVGYYLNEIINDCTKNTPASFEPVIDYVVTKIPRFTFEKFTGVNKELSSSMKSVGEAMAVGRSFNESLQKALRSLEFGLDGLLEISNDEKEIRDKLKQLLPERLLYIADAIRVGIKPEEISQITSYDLWFIREIEKIVKLEQELKQSGLPDNYDKMLQLKMNGFGDQRIARLLKLNESEVRKARKDLDVLPVFKKIDTCAAEFKSTTAYLYSCYEYNTFGETKCDSYPSGKNKIIILGSGPNRIGQGVEFDYTCVHAAYAYKSEGYEAIMINCNPETVSTDYDTSSKLYFEPITAENVLDIVDNELKSGNLVGVNIQFGGQTPLKLAKTFSENKVPVIGTSPTSIDIAEDRELFSDLLVRLDLKQPKNFICKNKEELHLKIKEIGYPVLIRPSYVLGGRAMSILSNDSALEDYLSYNSVFFENGPLLVDKYLDNASEVDVDILCDGKNVYVSGIMEHVEEAGVHSGDSACVIPPYSLSQKIIDEIIKSSKKLAIELKVIGLMNIQYAIKDDVVYVIEANPRASRTVPFVAKATKTSIANIAAKLMVGKTLKDFGLTAECFNLKLKMISVKQPVFPFARFNNVDTILGPEMKSTGESMGYDIDFASAYAKSRIAVGDIFPASGNAFISVKDSDKNKIIDIALSLINLGFNIVATKGTSKFLDEQGIKNTQVNKVAEGGYHVVDMIKAGEIQLIINTTEKRQSVADSFSIRRTALLQKVIYSVTIGGSKALVEAIKAVKSGKVQEVFSLQS